MKHQYESEILYHLMERDGFNIPSSVPPYEAEIKAYLINQVKLAYPKLTDYEAEWLLYNYTKHLPADFPISSVSNVTNATFENVVPFAFQSAILKGQTLANIAKQVHIVNNVSQPISDYITLVHTGNENNKSIRLANNGLLKPSTKYLIIFDIVENTLASKMQMSNGANICGFEQVNYNTYPIDARQTGIVKSVVTSKSDLTGVVDYLYLTTLFGENGDGTQYIKLRIMLIEYQQGMENWDIPYFEGMQSVKMPVLTTIGKNLLNHNWVKNTWYPFKLKSGTKLTLSTKDSVLSEGGNIRLKATDETDVWIGINEGAIKKTITLQKDVYKLSNMLNGNIEYQLEIGDNTPYEPYKSNILTVNEEVELSGIGYVKDTLDCLTGEVTERIGEIVLDGSENWILDGYSLNISGINDNLCFFTRDINNTYLGGAYWDNAGGILSSKLSTYGYNYLTGAKENYQGISIANGRIAISIDKDLLSSHDSIGLKEWLQSNPITIQYRLETESIKTVDLSSVNEKGESTYFMPLEGTMHVTSSSETIQPTFDMSVPVEATTQNLASFIDLEVEGE